MPRFRFFLFPPRAPPRPSSIPSPNAPASPRDPAAAPSAFAPPPAGSERQRRRGMAKARSLAKQKQAQQSNGGGGHALSSKLARYLDPEASLDKVRPARPSSCARAAPGNCSCADAPVSAWLLQDQLLDAVHWIRQAVGLICGLLWGAVPVVGAVWIALSVPTSP